MSLRFHWFLPTNGDGRDIVGGGHPAPPGEAPQTLSPFAPTRQAANTLAAS